MKWCTEVVRVHPKTGAHQKFIGEPVEAESQEAAQKWLDDNGMGYLTATDWKQEGSVDWPESDQYFKSIKLFGKLINGKQ